MYLGWYDPDKKKAARDKLAEAIERYVEKFGSAPETCLTNDAEAAELAADKRAPKLPVRGVPHVPRHTFYIGVDDEPVAMLEAAAA
jgi:hypothetical protein